MILPLLIDTHADFLEANTPRALCLHLYYRPSSPPSPLVPSSTVIVLLPIVLHCMLFGLFALAYPAELSTGYLKFQLRGAVSEVK